MVFEGLITYRVGITIYLIQKIKNPDLNIVMQNEKL